MNRISYIKGLKLYASDLLLECTCSRWGKWTTATMIRQPADNIRHSVWSDETFLAVISRSLHRPSPQVHSAIGLCLPIYVTMARGIRTKTVILIYRAFRCGTADLTSLMCIIVTIWWRSKVSVRFWPCSSKHTRMHKVYLFFNFVNWSEKGS